MNKNNYRDINLDFNMNPFTGDVIKATNSEAIKKSVRNLILSNAYDHPFRPSIGSGMRGALFEHFDPLNVEYLKSKVRELLEENEPRVNVLGITINQREDYNTLVVNLRYRILEVNRIEELDVFVERTR